MLQKCRSTSIGLKRSRGKNPDYHRNNTPNKILIMKALQYCSKHLWLLASSCRLELAVQDLLVWSNEGQLENEVRIRKINAIKPRGKPSSNQAGFISITCLSMSGRFHGKEAIKQTSYMILLSLPIHSTKQSWQEVGVGTSLMRDGCTLYGSSWVFYKSHRSSAVVPGTMVWDQDHTKQKENQNTPYYRNTQR